MDYQSLEKLLASIHQAISPTANSAVAGGVDSAAASNPLYLMMMQAAQPDVLNNHTPQMSGAPSPTPPVTNGGPMPPVGAPSGAPAAGSPGAPSPPISTSNFTPPAQSGAGSIPWWANATGANFGGGGVPTPSPRPAPAPAAPNVNPNGSIAGAVGPTSVGGAPLVNPNGSIPGAIGPTSVGGAQLAQSQPQQNGSALIQKMLQYLQQKTGSASVGNNADPSTFGG